MKKIILAVITISGLLGATGCGDLQARAAAQNENAIRMQIAQQVEINRTAPICTNEKDCNVKWEAAQLWVAHHAGLKIQLNTNVLIETYNSTDSDIAVRVTKESLGGGRYQLIPTIWCGDNPNHSYLANYGLLSCSPDAFRSALDFNQTVGAATP